MDKTKLEEKRQEEKDILSDMIHIYCEGQGHKAPCRECLELKAYALNRIERCPEMATKSFCSVCDIQCYGPDQSRRIREVMRYSGRRYFLVHPLQSIAHGWTTLRARRRQISQAKKKQVD